MTSAETPITVDDLRGKALHIKDLAEGEVRDIAQEKAAQAVAIGVVAVLVAVSIAYYLGTRRG